MSENTEELEIVTKGKEWELVTLTESIYAASPSPKQNIMHKIQTDSIRSVGPDTAHTMFMSGHFGYSSTMHDEPLPEPSIEEGDKLQSMHEKRSNLEGPLFDEHTGFRKYDDEKGDSMSFYSSEKFVCYDDGALVGVDEPVESTDPAGNQDLSNCDEEESSKPPNIPREAWWRRCADSLCGHVKSVNPYWSAAIAAAVVGIVIIGHRWHRDDRPQILRFKPLLAIDNEGCCTSL